MGLRILYGGTDHDNSLSHLKIVLDKASQLGFNTVRMATKKSGVNTLRLEHDISGTNSLKEAIAYGRTLNPPVELGICIDFYSYPPVFPPDPNNTDGNNNLFDPNYITYRPTTISGVFLNTAEYYQLAYVNDAIWLLQNTDANYFEAEEAVFCCKYDQFGEPMPDPSRIASLTAFLKRIRTALKAIKSSVQVGINIPSGGITGMQSEGVDPLTLAGKTSQYYNNPSGEPILDYITMQSGVSDPESFMNTFINMINLVYPLQVNAVDFIIGNETLSRPGCNRNSWTKICFNENYIGCLKALLDSGYSFGVFSLPLLFDNYPISMVDWQNAPPEAQNGSITDATGIIINSYNCPKPQFIFNINQV